MTKRLVVPAFLLLWPTIVAAQGGPPVITDDPWTPRPSHWEMNGGWEVEKSRGSSINELPSIDLNYGWGNRIQLKLEVPYLISSVDYQAHSAIGNFEAGVKYRFLENVGGFAASVYPQLVIPRSRVSGQTVGNTTKWSVFLPVEVARSIGSFDLAAEAGWWASGDDKNTGSAGLAVGYEVRDGLEFVAECNGEGARVLHPDEVFCGVGTRADITEHIALMGAFEPMVKNPDEDDSTYRVYFGAQVHVRGGGLWKGRRRQRLDAER